MVKKYQSLTDKSLIDLIMVLNAVWDADAPRSKVGIWKSHLYMHYSLTFSTEVVRFVPRGL